MTHLFVEQLTVIDCGLLDRTRGLVGTSWIVDAEIAGALDETGMIVDFGPAKRLIKQRVDAFADHRLLVPAGAPGLEAAATTDYSELTFTTDQGERIYHRAPLEAVRAIPGVQIEHTKVARLLEDEVTAALPGNVTALRLTLREEAIDGASYNYCHGLRKHSGQCQHVGHGHRSRLNILVNGHRSPELERRWCHRWKDVFLGNRDDLVNSPSGGRCRFAYQSNTGYFELALDTARCELIANDTTVENIAAFIADTLKAETPENEFTIRAYEGPHKGAIVSR